MRSREKRGMSASRMQRDARTIPPSLSEQKNSSFINIFSNLVMCIIHLTHTPHPHTVSSLRLYARCKPTCHPPHSQPVRWCVAAAQWSGRWCLTGGCGLVYLQGPLSEIHGKTIQVRKLFKLSSSLAALCKSFEQYLPSKS